MLPRFAVNRPVTVLMATLAVSTFGLLAVQVPHSPYDEINQLYGTDYEPVFKE